MSQGQSFSYPPPIMTSSRRNFRSMQLSGTSTPVRRQPYTSSSRNLYIPHTPLYSSTVSRSNSRPITQPGTPRMYDNVFATVPTNERIQERLRLDDMRTIPPLQTNPYMINFSMPHNLPSTYSSITNIPTMTNYSISDMDAVAVKQQQEAKTKAKTEAEKNAMAKTEAEQKVKAETEARAKVVADQKARAKAVVDQKARAKAEAEQKIRAKAEAEQKAMAKAETEQKAKAKAEAEKNARANAEAEQKAKAKVVADQKAEAEQKARANAEAEQKARAKAEARVKAEADQKARAIAIAKAEAEQEQKKIQYKLEQEQKVLAQKEREKQEYEKGLAHIEKLRQQRKNPAKIYTIAQSEVGATGTVEHANIPTWEQTSAKETTKIPTE